MLRGSHQRALLQLLEQSNSLIILDTKFCERHSFRKIFHTRKSGEITEFFAVSFSSAISFLRSLESTQLLLTFCSDSHGYTAAFHKPVLNILLGARTDFFVEGTNALMILSMIYRYFHCPTTNCITSFLQQNYGKNF